MKQYLDLMQDIIDNGIDHGDRTGAGRRSVYGRQLRFNLDDGFPMVTSRHTSFKVAKLELLWFLSGSVSNAELTELGVNIWTPWVPTYEDAAKLVDKRYPMLNGLQKVRVAQAIFFKHQNSIGPMYGRLMRRIPVAVVEEMTPGNPVDNIASDKILEAIAMYEIEKEVGRIDTSKVTLEEFITGFDRTYVDQMQELMIGLRDDPFSSRHMVVNWLPSWLPVRGYTPQENVLMGRGSLAPCHVLQQYHVYKDNTGEMRISLHLYMRSSDVAVGLPYNIAEYALLLSLIGKILGYKPHELIYTGGDVHLYSNHLEIAKKQVKQPLGKLPTLELSDSITDLFSIDPKHIRLLGYEATPFADKYAINV